MTLSIQTDRLTVLGGASRRLQQRHLMMELWALLAEAQGSSGSSSGI